MSVGRIKLGESAHAKFIASAPAISRARARRKGGEDEKRRRRNGRRTAGEKGGKDGGGNLWRNGERWNGHRGIIIKRDISYVGGRIVSATRHARRFCVLARSCAACALNKGYACACARPRYIRACYALASLIRRQAPRAM